MADLMDFWAALGSDSVAMSEIRRLLLMFYAMFLLWLICVEVFRVSIKKHRMKGLFEFHLLSFPAVVVGGFGVKLWSAQMQGTLMFVFPHVVLMITMMFFCVLEWMKPRNAG
jgi:hypothetical protein